MLLAAAPVPVPERCMSGLSLHSSGGSQGAPVWAPASEHSTHDSPQQGAPAARGDATAAPPTERQLQQPSADAQRQDRHQGGAAAAEHAPETYQRHAELRAVDAQEPLLAPNEERFCMYPIRC